LLNLTLSVGPYIGFSSLLADDNNNNKFKSLHSIIFFRNYWTFFSFDPLNYQLDLIELLDCLPNLPPETTLRVEDIVYIFSYVADASLVINILSATHFGRYPNLIIIGPNLKTLL